MNLTPPYMTEPDCWFPVNEAALRLQRSPRTIERWCRDGTVLAAGMSIYKDMKGKWWIRIVGR